MPVSIEVVPNGGVLSAAVNSYVSLKCKIQAYPKTSITWEKLVEDEYVIVEDDDRISSDYSEISETSQETSLNIKSIQTVDGSTYLCRARNKFNNESAAKISLFVLEPPYVRLEKIETLNPRTAAIYWQVDYDGNSPLKRLILQVKNYSLPDTDWLEVDENIKPNKTGSYVVRYLAPAVTYSFQLAAINEVGQSDWVAMNRTMPPDVPTRVELIHVLAKTNETLLIGWKRPLHDNGAQIVLYQMELMDSSNILVSNQTMDVTPGQARNNYMYIFVNLDPGSLYRFQVRACSEIGCGNWSDPKLEAITSDGIADSPQNVRLRCFYEKDQNLNYVVVSWDLPADSRGNIVGYNITLEGHSKYRNEDNKVVIDQFKQAFELKGNQSLEFRGTIKPNTNYTVRVCTINRSGCGPFSHITTDTMCTSSSTVPSAFPSQLKLLNINSSGKNSKKLKLILPRISERNGIIKCYKIILIKLPKNSNSDTIPAHPKDVNITTYSQTHSSIIFNDALGAYVAEEFDSDHLVNEVILGDDVNSKCSPENDVRSPRRINENMQSEDVTSSRSSDTSGSKLVYDGALAPSTNYSGFIEIRVIGPNGTLLSKQSGYFTPVLTGSLSSEGNSLSPLSPLFSSMSDSTTAIFIGVICGLTLVLLLLLFVLCFLKRKANESSSETRDEERLGLTALIRRTVGGHKNGHIPNNTGAFSATSPHKWIGQPVPIQNLPGIFQERHANSDILFQTEFEALPENFEDRTTHSSDLPENISKNRYPDIKSYDQTRVKLAVLGSNANSDYINADFVEGYKGRKLYICAQGPLDRTVADFWRMIYEHKVSVIVMLTGIEEHGKIKCAHYWNDEGTKEIDNLFQVVLQNVHKYSDYIVRRFTLQKTGESEAKEILQFHFLMWKDFLAPEQPSWLLRFIKRVNEHYCPDKGPLLVHCSAGVGRTGTFIAIDSLVPEITSLSSYINIFDCVSHLRYQRNYLVQSLKQYIFVYRALMEFAQFGDTEVEICHLRDHYRQLKEQKFDGNINGVMAEFDVSIVFAGIKVECLDPFINLKLSSDNFQQFSANTCLAWPGSLVMHQMI